MTILEFTALVFLSAFAVIGVFFSAVLYFWLFVRRKFREQKHEQLGFVERNKATEQCVMTMLNGSNVFLYISNIKDPAIAELFLRQLSVAYTHLSSRPDFDDLNLKVGYGLDKAEVSNRLLVELQKMGWHNA